MFNKLLFVHDGPIYVDRSDNSLYSVHYNDDLIERYQKIGNNVTFLMRATSVNKYQISSYTSITNKYFRLLEIPNYKSIFRFYKKLHAKKIIKTAVLNSDIVIVRLPSSAGLVAIDYANKFKKPVLVEVVACIYDALWNYDWRGKLLAYFKMYQYKKAIRNASHVLYVTNHFLQQRYPTRGISVGCTDVFISDPNPTVLANRLNRIDVMQDAKCITLATIAAIDVCYKGQDDVIKAVATLNKIGYDVKYKIVGQGSPNRLLECIRKFDVSQSVEIVGPVPHSQISKFLDSIDLYIQPSKQEGLPRAVIEAMSRACPIIGSSAGGIPELIDNDMVFKAGEFESLCRIIQSLTVEKLRDSAICNFNNSHRYSPDKVNIARNQFYTKFCGDFKLVTSK